MRVLLEQLDRVELGIVVRESPKIRSATGRRGARPANEERTLHALCRSPIRGRLSARSGLETRRLHALPREELVDRLAVHAEDASHAHGVETAVVNQTTDRLRMDTELRRDLSDADETAGLSAYRRHDPCKALQVPTDAA
jgi:hypothetical protein